MTLERLRAYARKRTTSPEHDPLEDRVSEVLATCSSERMFGDLLVPESMTLGYNTPFYADLGEEERLALNHWLYWMHYFRIRDGEVTAITFNEVIAQVLEAHEPDVAALLRLESAEERDHVAAFGHLHGSIAKHHGFEGVRFPVKPLRRVFIDRRLTRAMVRYFGADFVVVYFLGRGLINHMGRGFEKAVARTGSEHNGAIHEISRLHAMHENHHTAVSHHLSSLAHALLPDPEKASALYRVFFHLLRRTTVRSTFSETLTKRQEAAMSRLALRRMPALSGRSSAFLDGLVEAHFDHLSGVEAAKNAHIPRPNARIVRNASLREDHKAQWVRWMNADRGHLTFFPFEELVGEQFSQG